MLYPYEAEGNKKGKKQFKIVPQDSEMMWKINAWPVVQLYCSFESGVVRCNVIENKLIFLVLSSRSLNFTSPQAVRTNESLIHSGRSEGWLECESSALTVILYGGCSCNAWQVFPLFHLVNGECELSYITSLKYILENKSYMGQENQTTGNNR